MSTDRKWLNEIFYWHWSSSLPASACVCLCVHVCMRACVRAWHSLFYWSYLFFNFQELDRTITPELHLPEEHVPMFTRSETWGWGPSWWVSRHMHEYVDWLVNQDPLRLCRFGRLTLRHSPTTAGKNLQGLKRSTAVPVYPDTVVFIP